MEPLAQQQPQLSYKIRKWVGLEGQGQGSDSKTCTIVIGGRVRSGKSYAAVAMASEAPAQSNSALQLRSTPSVRFLCSLFDNSLSFDCAQARSLNV